MKKNYKWIVAIVLGVMLISTVYYFSFIKNAQTQYVNGRIVQVDDIETEEEVVAFSWHNEKLGFNDMHR